MYSDTLRLAKAIIKGDPELANDIYFALEEEMLQKQQPWEELSAVMHEWINPKPKVYGPCLIEEAEDGSGDGILTFPPELIEETGWKEGDTLNLEVSEVGTLIISKKE
jgi:hypothetical protein